MVSANEWWAGNGDGDARRKKCDEMATIMYEGACNHKNG